MNKIFFGLLILGGIAFSNEINSYVASKYGADFEAQDHQTKQKLLNEYNSIKTMAKTIETGVLKNDGDYFVAKNLLIIDIWKKKFIATYKPTNEELQELYKEQNPILLPKYELRNILVNYEKNADMILSKLDLVKDNKAKKDSFIKFVRSVSNDTASKNSDGLLPLTDENRLNPQIKEALQGKKEGDVFKVNMQELGTQIIYIEKIVPSRQATFEESQDALINLAKQNSLNKEINKFFK